MIIQPLRKPNGDVYSNIELIKIYYEKLVAMRDGKGYNNIKAKERAEDDFYRICGGSGNADLLMRFMKQIVDEPDPDKAQKLFARALEPVTLKKGEKKVK